MARSASTKCIVSPLPSISRVTFWRSMAVRVKTHPQMIDSFDTDNYSRFDAAELGQALVY